MSSSVTYRAAGPADAAIVYDLVCELAVYEKLAHEVVSTPKHFEDILLNPDRFFAIWRSRMENLWGFALVFTRFRHFWVSPGFISRMCMSRNRPVGWVLESISLKLWRNGRLMKAVAVLNGLSWIGMNRA
jgi:hypothetical protein